MAGKVEMDLGRGPVMVVAAVAVVMAPLKQVAAYGLHAEVAMALRSEGWFLDETWCLWEMHSRRRRQEGQYYEVRCYLEKPKPSNEKEKTKLKDIKRMRMTCGELQG